MVKKAEQDIQKDSRACRTVGRVGQSSKTKKKDRLSFPMLRLPGWRHPRPLQLVIYWSPLALLHDIKGRSMQVPGLLI